MAKNEIDDSQMFRPWEKIKVGLSCLTKKPDRKPNIEETPKE
jgi:hypothetical protein